MDVKDAFSLKKNMDIQNYKKVPKECIFSMGGGTMRNSRGEIDILVLCKAISLKTLYMNIYTTTRKTCGGVPL